MKKLYTYLFNFKSYTYFSEVESLYNPVRIWADFFLANTLAEMGENKFDLRNLLFESLKHFDYFFDCWVFSLNSFILLLRCKCPFMNDSSWNDQKWAELDEWPGVSTEQDLFFLVSDNVADWQFSVVWFERNNFRFSNGGFHFPVAVNQLGWN
jgi:hypothetical protein